MKVEKDVYEEGKTGAVIVAAGMSSRMGDFKPMLQMGSISIVKRIITNFQQAGVFPIVLVTGFRAEELEKHVSRLGVICLRNEDYESTQMVDSACLGLSYIQDKCDRAFFSPVDVPLFTVATVKRIMRTEKKIAMPTYDGAEGHPTLFSCDILPAILAADHSRGLRRAMDGLAAETEWIAVDDEGVLKDADTPDDYEKMVEYHSRQMLRPIVDISLMREDKIFDKDGALLLHMIEYDGTVKCACDKLGISYSKAWNLLATLEKNLGFALIERRAGGEYGGNSRLTERGRELLEQYERYRERVRRFADECFSEYFDVDEQRSE